MKLGTEVFKPGICWAVEPASRATAAVYLPERLCGHPAVEYLVTKDRGTIVTKMYVCMTHRARMEKRGYIFRLTK